MNNNKLNPRHALGFLTWKASRVFINHLQARLNEAGMNISVEQLRPLFPLYRFETMSQGKLCDILSQEKTGVSRLVAGLEKRGYLRREASSDDRRVKNLTITKAGIAAVDTACELVEANRLELTSDIDPDELEICKKVLWQFIEPHLDCCTVESAIPEENEK